MGLAGLLIVRPEGFDPSDPATWTAYGPGSGSEYDVERVLILGEVDSRLHDAVVAGLAYDPVTFNPDWFNGRAFQTLVPGRTCDVILTAPTPGMYAVFDRDLYHATNEGRFPGGMMTVLDVLP